MASWINTVFLKKDMREMSKINAEQAALSEFSCFTAQTFVSGFLRQGFFALEES